jgi:L-ribulose-5-phosphate 3-epimerase
MTDSLRTEARTLSRRRFLDLAGAGASVLALGERDLEAAAAPATGFSGTLCLFSKHLPDLDWRALGRTVRGLGFGGVDLTVRPGGHVLPERVADDLPAAVTAIREEGGDVPLITTALLSSEDRAARPTFEAAGRLRVPFVKPGYYRYEFRDVRAELSRVGDQLRSLIRLAAENGVAIGFHNHSGNVGGPVWDIATILDTVDARHAGYYFDVRHAVVEGGDVGWRVASHLVLPRLKLIAVKDFYWEKVPGKGWRMRNCPLGEGMVNWPEFMKILANGRFQGPVSLHIEYDIPGATRTAIQENTLAAAGRDLAFLRARIQEAYGG